MRVMLALLLRDFAWEVQPNQDLGYVMVPFPRPKEGLRVRFGRVVGDLLVDEGGGNGLVHGSSGA